MGPFLSIINYGGPPGGIGSSIVKPTYFADTITCGDKPPPSAESKLKLADDADQPVLMCPGEKAKYVCNTDGINVRFDEPTTDEYEVACKVKKNIYFPEFHKKYSSNSNSISRIFVQTDQSYAVPGTWPVCVSKLDCIEPPIDDGVMEYDWSSGTGVTPPFDVKYRCIWAGKKIVKNSDLAKGLEDSVVDDITISCQDNGTYVIVISRIFYKIKDLFEYFVFTIF